MSVARAVVRVAPPWLLPAASAAAGALGCVVLTAVDPRDPGNYPACPFLLLTGRWCPGCGTLRGLNRLLHADLGAALGYNALMVLALPYLLFTWLAWASPRCGGPSLPSLRLPHRVVWGVFAIVCSFWVLRNIPLAPFTALAP